MRQMQKPALVQNETNAKATNNNFTQKSRKSQKYYLLRKYLVSAAFLLFPPYLRDIKKTSARSISVISVISV